MEINEIFKAYLEVGILGLCAIFTIGTAWINFKHIQKQNQEYQEMQLKNNEILINKLVEGVVNHVPSKEENEKLTKVSEEIDGILGQLLLRTNASRACLVQYHNGGKGVNKQSFLKMSITNEQVNLGVKPFISEFKDQFRSVLSFFTKEIGEVGYCYIQDLEDMKDVDNSMYVFLRDRGVESSFGYSIKDSNGYTIGFVCLEFIDKSKVNLTEIDNAFKDNCNVLEILLGVTV